MVNPDVGASLDADGIASVGQHLADGEIANDDVGDILNVQGDAFELGARVNTKNRLVTADAGLSSTRNGALDVDDSSAISLGSLSESRERRDGRSGTSGAASGTTAWSANLRSMD